MRLRLQTETCSWGVRGRDKEWSADTTAGALACVYVRVRERVKVKATCGLEIHIVRHREPVQTNFTIAAAAAHCDRIACFSSDTASGHRQLSRLLAYLMDSYHTFAVASLSESVCEVAI